jgi:hypothetical protein
MTNEETCAELMSAFDQASLPDGDTDAAREAAAASLRTLPDRASEDLKDVVPTITKMVTVMNNDVKNDTHELDTFLSDPAASAEYDKAEEAISTLCFPEATEEEVVQEEAVEEEVVQEEAVQEEAVEEEAVEPETAE